MYSIRFTEQADADLLGIYIYTYNTWNEDQAIEYRGTASVAATKCNKRSAVSKKPNIEGGFISSAYVFEDSFFHRIGDSSRKAIAKI